MDFLDPITATRAFYILSAAAIVVARVSTPLKDRFLSYGARDSRSSLQTGNRGTPQESQGLSQLLNYLATLKVPHNWFSHFYFLSTFCSAFWLWQICNHGAAFLFVGQQIKSNSHLVEYNASFGKAIFSLALLSIQGLRRLDECIVYTKPSQSTMWIGHYAIGMAFYLVTNVGIWIEQVPDILGSPKVDTGLIHRSWKPNYLDVAAFVVFCTASICQHYYHTYLSGLPKYTLPDKWAFRSIIAPHYTAECTIYLSLAILSASNTSYVNWTMISALIFVLVNLGVTADGTKQWMEAKFSDRRDNVRKRWRMIPWLW